MRPIYLLLICLFSAFAVNSQVLNSVIVKGYITNTNGAAVSNWPVKVIPDTSSTVRCSHKQTVYTNANGFYIDTLTCTNPLLSVTIYTMNCNNTSIVRTLQVPSSKVIESNFILCSTTGSCTANFSFSVTGNTAYFTNTSTASNGGIISQNIWSFGDGTSSTQSSVSHTYSSSGTYVVRLTIITNNTSSGCSDSTNELVTISPTTLICHANFYDSIVNKTAFFSSSSSTTSSGDYIVERFWNFGDPN